MTENTTGAQQWYPPPGAATAASQPDPAPGGMVVSGTFVTDRLDLPSGGWVEFHDPRDLKGRDYKRVMRGMKDVGPGHDGAATVDLLDGLIAILVAKWDIPYLPAAPLPADMITITDELTIEDLRALQVAVQPAFKMIFPTESTATGPGSPTPPASA